MTLNRLILCAVFTAGSLSLIAGDSEQKLKGHDRKVFRKAERQFMFCDYERALPRYLEVLNSNPGNMMTNYRVGICYYYTAGERQKSITYFEKAMALSAAAGDTLPDLLYYAGTTYQSLNKYDEAMICFSALQKNLKSKSSVLDVDRLIATCRNGKEMMADSVNAVIINLGPNINTKFPEYAPVITSDETMLLFTSKRKGTTGGKMDDMGQYYEDVYMSHGQYESWNTATRYDSTFRPLRGLRKIFGRASNVDEINTSDHDGSICLSPDGRKMYIFRYSDVWTAEWNGKSWSAPERMDNFINKAASHEPSVTLSGDGQTMLLVSDRRGGKGGKDIYSCQRKADGTWGEPQNLGDAINTEYDEDAPFLSQDGKTLYFSSIGHKSVGGYDVFRSNFENGNWSAPQNLGYPVNGGGDDVFYTPVPNTNRAYFASSRTGSYGDLDIFSVEILPWDHWITVKPVIAFDGEPGKVKMTLTNEATKKDTVLEMLPGASGKWKFEPGSNYLVKLEAPGYKPAQTSISFGSDKRLNNLYEEIRFEKIDSKNGTEKVKGQQIQLWNAFYDVDREMQKMPAYATLPNRSNAMGDYLKTLDTTSKREGFSIITLRDVSVSRDSNPDVFAFEPILFDFDRSEIRGDAKAELDKVVRYMTRYPQLKFEVVGHTDSKGGDDYNMALSRRRAEMAKKYLAANGISQKRMKSSGSGETAPVAANENKDGSDNPEGRQKNRRVEIIILR